MLLEQAYADALEALRENERQLRKLSDELPRLRAEVEGLRLALVRHGHNVPDRIVGDKNEKTSAEPNFGDAQWSELSRPAAIRRVLAEVGGPLSPTELSKRLQAAGRENDNTHYVSAALNYLKRSGLVETVSRGQWALTEAIAELANSNGNGRAPGEVAPLFLGESEERPDN